VDITISQTVGTATVTETVTVATVSNTGAQGATGATGATGASGVISVTSPITNTGSSTAAQIGIDQTLLTISPSQVIGTAADLADNTFTGKQTLAPSTTEAASLNLANGTAPTSPTTGDLWAASGSLIYQSSLGGQTLAFLSSNITGNAASITGTITPSQVTGTAAIVGANTFTGKQTLPARDSGGAPLNIPNSTNSIASPSVGDVYMYLGKLYYANSAGAQGVASNSIDNGFSVGQTISSTSSSALSINNTSVYAINVNAGVSSSNFVVDANGAVQVSPTSSASRAASVVLSNGNAVGVSITANASQSSNLLQILASDNSTVRASISSVGALTVSPSSGTAATINAASSAVGLVIAANGVDSLQVNVAGSKRSSISGFGNLLVRTGSSSFGGSLDVGTFSDTVVGVMVRSNSTSQTADLQQWQSSAATVLGGRNAAGQTFAGSTAAVVGSTTTALTSAAYTSATVAVFTYGGTSLVQVGQTVTVAGVTGGAYNGTWVVSAVTSTTFTVLGSGFTNNAGTGGTFTLSAVASFTAGTAAITPLVVKGAGSQSANYQEWQTNLGSAFCTIFGGGLSHTGRIDLGGSLRLGSTSQSLGGGAGGLLAMANATTVPSTNPTGGILYVESGALKYRGSSGTVTTIAAA